MIMTTCILVFTFFCLLGAFLETNKDYYELRLSADELA